MSIPPPARFVKRDLVEKLAQFSTGGLAEYEHLSLRASGVSQESQWRPLDVAEFAAGGLDSPSFAVGEGL